MIEMNQDQKQRYERVKELFEISRQRYLDAGGDRREPAFGNDYLTEEELKEFLAIARRGIEIISSEVHCQGRVWKKPDNSTNNQAEFRVRPLRKLTEQEKQQYARYREILAIGHQRYLDAGGDPRRSLGALHNNGHLTTEERKELFSLGRKVAGVQNIDDQLYCVDKSGEIPDKSTTNTLEVKCES